VANDDAPPVDVLRDDSEARLECLVDAGVFEVSDGEVTTTVSFEDTRAIYADSYAEETVSQAEFVETVAEAFDVETATARERVEAGEVTRHDVVTYLSLQSFLDGDPSREIRAMLAELAVEVGVGSPVPDDTRELTDADYREFLEAAGDAVVFVWKYPCDPCRRMKGELPGVLETLPEGVAVAGVDGEAVSDFRADYEIETAPTVLLFADGELADRHEGYTPPDGLEEAFADVYGEPS
jgi:thiol-disulfide isomerase/thioredoxin